MLDQMTRVMGENCMGWFFCLRAMYEGVNLLTGSVCRRAPTARFRETGRFFSGGGLVAGRPSGSSGTRYLQFAQVILISGSRGHGVDRSLRALLDPHLSHSHLGECMHSRILTHALTHTITASLCTHVFHSWTSYTPED